MGTRGHGAPVDKGTWGACGQEDIERRGGGHWAPHGHGKGVVTEALVVGRALGFGGAVAHCSVGVWGNLS